MAYNIRTMEEQVRARWRKLKLLDRIDAANRAGEPYFLLDGPPYANDQPHVGHIRNTVYKDLYIRLAMMRGRRVLFQPGFDTHGLPIENMVERKLKLKSKREIERYGIGKFTKLCRDHAILNKDLWIETYDLLGSWYSWREPYLTFENSYLESAWWAFKQIWKKGMVYRGKRPVHWCPKCQTALAGYETTDTYKNVSDPSVVLRFKIKDREDEYLLVYTTTPWTLPANVAIAAHPEKEYVKAKTKQWGTLILAKNCLRILDDAKIPYETIETFPGKQLDQLRYEPLLDVPVQRELANDDRAHKVVMSIPLLKQRVASKVGTKKKIEGAGDLFEDFVTDIEGTGLVHTAPGHGKTDNMVGQHYHLREVSPLDDACRFTDQAAPFNGKFVKDADHEIAEALHRQGSLLVYERIEHSYPLCWRCKSPLIFRLSDQWFMKVDAIKQRMLDENDAVLWQPDYARERFESWVANAEDWNFSRQRYWGIPIPIWRSEDGEESLVIESREELATHAAEPLPDDFDLHAASEIELISPQTKKRLRRTPEIFDVWFDSGVAPLASLGYPKMNEERFKEHYPVARINESQDQIRGWFYSLMFCGVATFDRAPYQAVSMPGWVLDANGEKMSKSIGNVLLAREGLKSFGADPIRFYYCWDVAPHQTQRFNEQTIRSEVMKFFTILHNLHELVRTHEELPELQPGAIEDEWILSRVHTVANECERALDTFELHLAGRAIYDFVVNDLSRGYVQFVRERLEKESQPSRIIAYCLQAICRLLAPISPHIADEVYVNLAAIVGGKESVHLESYHIEGARDEQLERRFAIAQEIIAAGLACRDAAKRNVRWPCKELVIDTDEEEVRRAVDQLGLLIKTQLNVRMLRVDKMKVALSFKPNYRLLGKQFGERTADVLTAIKTGTDTIREQLEKGATTLNVGEFTITPEHLTIAHHAPEGYALSPIKQGRVFLDTRASAELDAEGYAREVMRRVQAMRKEEGLNKGDLIELTISSEELAASLRSFADTIKQRVGARELSIIDGPLKVRDGAHKLMIKSKPLFVLMRRSS